MTDHLFVWLLEGASPRPMIFITEMAALRAYTEITGTEPPDGRAFHCIIPCSNAQAIILRKISTDDGKYLLPKKLASN